MRDEKKVLGKGYGLANLEHRIPITPSTVFDVASVSKQFTGLAAMLIEQGRIKLTDDIRKYIPELVARVTGQSFRAWTDGHLFRPLGMTSTRFRDDHTWVVPSRAYRYSRTSDSGYAAATDNLTALGSSSLFTTVDDLAKWVMNFADAKAGGQAAMPLGVMVLSGRIVGLSVTIDERSRDIRFRRVR